MAVECRSICMFINIGSSGNKVYLIRNRWQLKDLSFPHFDWLLHFEVLEAKTAVEMFNFTAAAKKREEKQSISVDCWRLLIHQRHSPKQRSWGKRTQINCILISRRDYRQQPSRMRKLNFDFIVSLIRHNADRSKLKLKTGLLAGNHAREWLRSDEMELLHELRLEIECECNASSSRVSPLAWGM